MKARGWRYFKRIVGVVSRLHSPPFPGLGGLADPLHNPTSAAPPFAVFKGWAARQPAS